MAAKNKREKSGKIEKVSRSPGGNLSTEEGK